MDLVRMSTGFLCFYFYFYFFYSINRDGQAVASINRSTMILGLRRLRKIPRLIVFMLTAAINSYGRSAPPHSQDGDRDGCPVLHTASRANTLIPWPYRLQYPTLQASSELTLAGRRVGSPLGGTSIKHDEHI